jgi:phytoene desaturase
MVIKRLEERTGEAIRQQIILRRDYAYSNFVSDYHSFKGNAYGLANTLNQTAILKPKMQSNKVKNLTYTGQLTVPGPGVPPSLISGKIAARLIHKKNQSHA